MKKKISYLWILPQLFLSTIFLLGISYGFIKSFLGENGLSLEHYQEIMGRGDTVPSIFYTLRLSLLSSFLSLALAILFSFFLLQMGEKWKRLEGFFRIAIMMPHSLVALFFLFLLSSNGFLARLFYSFSWISSQTDFPALVYDEKGIGIILSYLWKELPFVLFFSLPLAYQVDEKAGEAARCLGANPFQAFWKITLPLSIRQYLAAFFIIFSFSFGAFDLPYLLGATSPKALSVLSYQELQRGFLQRPVALAYNGIILLFSLFLSYFYFKFLPKKKT